MREIQKKNNLLNLNRANERKLCFVCFVTPFFSIIRYICAKEMESKKNKKKFNYLKKKWERWLLDGNIIKLSCNLSCFDLISLNINFWVDKKKINYTKMMGSINSRKKTINQLFEKNKFFQKNMCKTCQLLNIQKYFIV